MPSAATGELYLTELVRLARADDRPVACLEVDDDGSLLGINDRVELADAQVEMRIRINERHMRAGVTIVDPATTWIEAAVTIGEDVTIEPGVVLGGATEIGRDVIIRSGSQILDSRVGERSVVWASVIEASTIEAGRDRGAVRPCPGGVPHRVRRPAGQLRRGQEQPRRRGLEEPPLQLPRRRRRRSRA